MLRSGPEVNSGASLTGVTEILTVPEVDVVPSETLYENEPKSVLSSFRLASGVKVSPVS